MWNSSVEEEEGERRALSTARPWWAVEPVMRMFLGAIFRSCFFFKGVYYFWSDCLRILGVEGCCLVCGEDEGVQYVVM